MKKSTITWRSCCGIEWKVIAILREFHGIDWGFTLVKEQVNSGLGTKDGCLALGGLVAPEGGL